MKLISLVFILLLSTAFADETCSTSLYDFRITKNYIESAGQNGTIRVGYSEVRTLSRRNYSDFMEFVSTLTNEISTDEILTQSEAAQVYRFSLTLADDFEDLVGLMYAKGYDKSGYLIVRYVLTDNGAYRCK